mgnify:CR=1 FL=1
MQAVFIYKTIHLVGLVIFLLGLGGAIAATREQFKPYAILHGIGLFVMLLGGFGMQARLGYDILSPALVTKLLIWLVLGGLLVVAKRQVLPKAAIWSIVIVLAGAAAYIGVSKALPFA